MEKKETEIVHRIKYIAKILSIVITVYTKRISFNVEQKLL